MNLSNLLSLLFVSKPSQDRSIVSRNLSILASESLQFDKENIVAEQRKGSNKGHLSPCSITTNSISTDNLNLAVSHDLTYGKNRMEFNDSSANKCGCVHLTGTLDAHTSHPHREPEHSPSRLCIGDNDIVTDTSMYLSLCNEHTTCNKHSEGSTCLMFDNPVNEFPCTEAGESKLSYSNSLITATCLETDNKHQASLCLGESIPSRSASLLRDIESTTPHHGSMNHTVQSQGLSCEHISLDCCEPSKPTDDSSRIATQNKRKRKKLQTIVLTSSQPDLHTLVSTNEPLSSCFNTSISSLPTEFTSVPSVRNRKTKRRRACRILDPSIPVRITRSRAALMKEQDNIIGYCELTPIKKKRNVQDSRNSSPKKFGLAAKRVESIQCITTSSQKVVGSSISEAAALLSNKSTPIAQVEGEVGSQPKTSSPFQPFAQCTTTPPAIEVLLDYFIASTSTLVFYLHCFHKHSCILFALLP